MKLHSRKRRLDHFRFHSPFQSVDLLFNRHFIRNWSIFREIKDKLGITHCFKKFARQESKVTAIFAKSVNLSLTDNQLNVKKMNLARIDITLIPRLFSPPETRLKLCHSQSSYDTSQNKYLFTMKKATEMTINGVRIGELKRYWVPVDWRTGH